ncbi:MAG: ferredoxin family protein [Thermoplasmata archaeon]|nr:ferredoxin family protein [Thermoplasmata archaeon]
MAYVIGEKCLGEKYGLCAEVCPVECIHPGEYKGEELMVVDPDECIDCGACVPACPIGAIAESVDDDPEWAKINAELTPKFKGNPPGPTRAADDPPRKPGNKLV